jgi:hypothetical protein
MFAYTYVYIYIYLGVSALKLLASDLLLSGFNFSSKKPMSLERVLNND